MMGRDPSLGLTRKRRIVIGAGRQKVERRKMTMVMTASTVVVLRQLMSTTRAS